MKKGQVIAAIAGALGVAFLAANASARPAFAGAGGRTLKSGLWVYLWLGSDSSRRDSASVIARCREFGFRGVIAMDGLNNGRIWAAEHGPALESAGIAVAVGIAMDGVGSRTWEQHRQNCLDAITAALDTPYPIVLDWEGRWEDRRTGGDDAHRDDAMWIARALNASAGRGRGIGRITDVPWYRPTYHSNAPTLEFGLLCENERYPQCYGGALQNETPEGVEGRSARFLALAREEYARLARRWQVPPWPIEACVQGYRRTVRDHVDLIRQEIGAGRAVIYWHLYGLDEACKTALRSIAR